jgi:hypothetical protein
MDGNYKMQELKGDGVRRKSVTIYNPNLKEGGTSLLYARLARFLIENSTYDITVVDYKEGVTSKYLNARGLPFHLIEFTPEKKVTIDPPPSLW